MVTIADEVSAPVRNLIALTERLSGKFGPTS